MGDAPSSWWSPQEITTEIERLRAERDSLRADLTDANRFTANIFAQRDALLAASDKLGAWMSAALDDPNVCTEMKSDINAWFAAIEAAEGE